jgi:RNA polymerase-binding transcription factor
MTKTDLDHFRDTLRIKQAELALRSRTRENIAVERSADALEEVAFKSAREIAVAQLHRESVVGRDVALALKRLDDQAFGECLHCGSEISRRRLEAVPWAPFCIRCQESLDRGDESVLLSIEPAFLDAA